MSKSSSHLFLLIVLACATESRAGSMTAFISVILNSNGSGGKAWPVLTFTPATSIPDSGKLTLTFPSGYFLGMPSCPEIMASVRISASMLAQPLDSSSTSLVLTTRGQPTGVASVTMTLVGLTLGSPKAFTSNGFSLASSEDTTALQLDAPAIVAGITSFSVTLGLSSGAGSMCFPVLAFNPINSIPAGGSITITMPTGYFVGTASFASGDASVAAMTGSSPAVTTTSTSIVITTALAASGTSAFTVTIYGLSLGSPQREINVNDPRITGLFVASTSVMAAGVGSLAPATYSPFFKTSSIAWTPDTNIANTQITVILVFMVTSPVAINTVIQLFMPSGYFVGSASWTAGQASIPAMSGTRNGDSTTNIIWTIAGANIPAQVSVTVTLNGLSLGSAMAAGGFYLTRTGQSHEGNVFMLAPLIGTAVASPSINVSTSNMESGAKVKVVISFTPTVSIPAGGSITITMPTGYFVGTASFASGDASVAAMTGSSPAVTTTSTSLVITTALAASGTSAFTVTINGLELGSPRISGIFKLSTSADGGFVSLVAPAIVSQTATPISSPQSSNEINVGAIAGGIVAGIVLIAIVSFLIWKKVRNSSAIPESKATPSQNALETEIPQMHSGADLPQQVTSGEPNVYTATPQGVAE
jgi:hypothetical protein